MRFFCSFLALLLVSLVAAPAQAAPRQWLHLESDHFVFYTDLDEEAAKKVILDLEKFRFTVGQLTGLDLSEDPAPRLKIYGFSKLKTYQKDMNEARTLGIYQASANGAASAMSLENGKKIWQTSGIQVIFHEYVHHITNQYSSLNYPRWYSEGFAEYLGTMEFDGKKAIIGKPAVQRFPLLKTDRNWLRMNEIFKIKGEYVGKVRNQNRLGEMYAQGWLLAHYIHNSGRGRTTAIGDFIKGINQPGSDYEKLFQETFKTSFSDFDKEVKSYWFGRELAVGVIDLTDKMPDFKLSTVRALSKAESKIIVDEALLLTGKLWNSGGKAKRRKKEVKKRFVKALAAGVRPLDLNMYLARIARVDDDYTSAGKYIDAALEIAPDNVAALTLKGKILDESPENKENSPALLRRVKNLYAKAIKIDPSYLPALTAYVYMTFRIDVEVKPETFEILESIRYLAPALNNGKSMEVAALRKAKRYDEAKAKLQLMIDWAFSDKYLRALKKRMEGLKAAAAAHKRSLATVTVEDA
ncbi:MAG: hypothetical protein COB37_05270 [Kordiimonadales bacterium]|nr:MAG: hypothetical protein COB37_05270 [Kordiimonadales bacterium]